MRTNQQGTYNYISRLTGSEDTNKPLYRRWQYGNESRGPPENNDVNNITNYVHIKLLMW